MLFCSCRVAFPCFLDDRPSMVSLFSTVLLYERYGLSVTAGAPPGAGREVLRENGSEDANPSVDLGRSRGGERQAQPRRPAPVEVERIAGAEEDPADLGFRVDRR